MLSPYCSGPGFNSNLWPFTVCYPDSRSLSLQPSCHSSAVSSFKIHKNKGVGWGFEVRAPCRPRSSCFSTNWENHFFMDLSGSVVMKQDTMWSGSWTHLHSAQCIHTLFSFLLHHAEINNNGFQKKNWINDHVTDVCGVLLVSLPIVVFFLMQGEEALHSKFPVSNLPVLQLKCSLCI